MSDFIDVKDHIEGLFLLPCVVDVIDFEKQLVLDIIQHKDQLFSKGQKINYNGINSVIEKKLSDTPIKTEHNINGRLSIRKVRYYCQKIINNE